MRTLVLLPLCLVVAACATTAPKQHPQAQLEIQEAVGFTITEKVSVSENVRADYEQALFLLEQGRTADGIAILENVVAEAPNVSGPRIDLGIAWRREGNLEAAEEHLVQALALNANHPVIHNELGIIYRQTGRFAEARRSYEAALQIYPGYHHARRNLGVLCDLYLVDLECALASYEAYMQTVPGDDEAAMWIADLRYRIGQQE
ncbi:MAG: tetratricopeptide repeat protein [Gammaproteobacteria bacterium]|nr:tetratricopeptide repeat protein [Gammaproteobacteria bacterium]